MLSSCQKIIEYNLIHGAQVSLRWSGRPPLRASKNQKGYPWMILKIKYLKKFQKRYLLILKFLGALPRGGYMKNCPSQGAPRKEKKLCFMTSS